MIRSRILAAPATLALLAGFAAAVTPAAHAAAPSDDTPVLVTPKGEHENGDDDQNFDKLLDAYYATRLLSGDSPITLTQAAALRGKAAAQASALPSTAPAGATRGGAWTSQGPNPIVQVGRTSSTFEAVAGRIGALAIRNDGTIVLGAAQGGV